jgi:hypothetical protein
MSNFKHVQIKLSIILIKLEILLTIFIFLYESFTNS